MNIDSLREFEHLARSLNFHETAQHFFVSTSVISRHISALEDELKVKLFDRSKQGVKLTNAGTMFLVNVRSILLEYDTAIRKLSQLNKEKRIIRLGYLHNAARPFIVEFSTYLKRQHPDIKIAYKGMSFRDLYYALDYDLVDLNFMLDLLPVKNEYDVTTMYRDMFCVVAGAQSDIANSGASVSLGQLEEHKLLLPDKYVFPGLEGKITTIFSANPNISFSHVGSYLDVDSMYIEVGTDNSVGLSTSANCPHSSDIVRYVPIEGVDAGINVNAYLGEGLDKKSLAACCEAITRCQRQLKYFDPIENLSRTAS